MLLNCDAGATVKVVDLMTEDAEFRDFLLTLGCYEGQEITVISKKRHSMVVAVKDGRYNIDDEIAKLILVA